jgi:hypothetical protein
LTKFQTKVVFWPVHHQCLIYSINAYMHQQCRSLDCLQRKSSEPWNENDIFKLANHQLKCIQIQFYCYLWVTLKPISKSIIHNSGVISWMHLWESHSMPPKLGHFDLHFTVQWTICTVVHLKLRSDVQLNIVQWTLKCRSKWPTSGGMQSD